jgi:protein Tex
VHPETYFIVEKMAKDLDCTVADLMKDETLRKKIKLEKYVSDKVGLPTLTDIMAELAKPGRDPRDKFETVEFAEGINSMEDLRVGMQLNGIVTNITNFGAFVDIGVHQDGLVHISQMSNSFIKSPHEVVKVQQKVMVTVTEVDVARKRIALSMVGEVPENTKMAKPKNKPENTAKFNQSDKKNQPTEEPEGDLQSKLAALKAKFK